MPGAGKIGERVGKVIGKYKMAKHFTWSIDDDGVFTYGRDEAAIAAEARLLYVIRLPQSELDGPGTVRAYKRLSSVERAFRSLKTVDLKVRPVYHRTEPRAHVFLCMLAYYVEWHMRQRLKPMLFDDEDAEGARRSSVVAPAEVSASARAKTATKRTPGDGTASPPSSAISRPSPATPWPCERQTLPSHHAAHAAPEKGTQAPGREAVVYPVRRF